MSRRSDATGKSPDNDSIGAATKLLAEATAALTAAVKEGVAEGIGEAQSAAIAGLREAAGALVVVSSRADGGGNRRERQRSKAERTRAELLTAAAKVFAEKGYEGATVGDIAAAAGYTKGAVYAHFPSKSDVFMELVKHVFVAQADQPCAEELDLPPGPERQAALERWIGDVEGQPGIPLALEFLSHALRHPESQAVFAPQYAEAFERLTRQIAGVRRKYADAEGGRSPGGLDDESLAEIALDEEDWDRALVIMSLANLVPLLAAITDSPHIDAASAARVVERILTT